MVSDFDARLAEYDERAAVSSKRDDELRERVKRLRGERYELTDADRASRRDASPADAHPYDL